ncbi:unnamed protein product, partial [Laminaria digitata]
MGSATKRARLLQESGEVNYEKRKRLYQQVGSTGPPSSGANILGEGNGKGKGGAVGSPLLAALERCGREKKSGKKTGGGAASSTTSAAAAEGKEEGEGERCEALGPLDEAWLTLTRPANERVATAFGVGAGLASPHQESGGGAGAAGSSPRKRFSSSTS